MDSNTTVVDPKPGSDESWSMVINTVINVISFVSCAIAAIVIGKQQEQAKHEARHLLLTSHDVKEQHRLNQLGQLMVKTLCVLDAVWSLGGAGGNIWVLASPGQIDDRSVTGKADSDQPLPLKWFLVVQGFFVWMSIAWTGCMAHYCASLSATSAARSRYTSAHWNRIYMSYASVLALIVSTSQGLSTVADDGTHLYDPVVAALLAGNFLWCLYLLQRVRGRIHAKGTQNAHLREQMDAARWDTEPSDSSSFVLPADDNLEQVRTRAVLHNFVVVYLVMQGPSMVMWVQRSIRPSSDPVWLRDIAAPLAALLPIFNVLVWTCSASCMLQGSKLCCPCVRQHSLLDSTPKLTLGDNNADHADNDDDRQSNWTFTSNYPSSMNRPGSFSLTNIAINPYEIRLGPVIGQGGVGVVHKCRVRGTTGALKLLIDSQKASSATKVAQHLEEAQRLAQLRHRNVVCFMGIVHMDDSRLGIVTEYCERGSLRDLLKYKDFSFPWSLRLRILLDSLEGLQYLHRHSPQMLHQDLKSMNILVDRNATAKLGDFGYCDSTAAAVSRAQRAGPRGTIAWMAPELLRDSHPSTHSDIWSMGMIMYELLTRIMPFQGLQRISVVVRAVRAGAVPFAPRAVAAAAPSGFVQMMRLCWHSEPCKRPSVDQLLRQTRQLLRDVGSDAVPQTSDDCASCSSLRLEYSESADLAAELGGDLEIKESNHSRVGTNPQMEDPPTRSCDSLPSLPSDSGSPPSDDKSYGPLKLGNWASCTASGPWEAKSL